MLNISGIPEFFVFTGEEGENDLHPIALEECAFVLPYGEYDDIEIPYQILNNAHITDGLIYYEEKEIE